MGLDEVGVEGLQEIVGGLGPNRIDVGLVTVVHVPPGATASRATKKPTPWDCAGRSILDQTPTLAHPMGASMRHACQATGEREAGHGRLRESSRDAGANDSAMGESRRAPRLRRADPAHDAIRTRLMEGFCYFDSRPREQSRQVMAGERVCREWQPRFDFSLHRPPPGARRKMGLLSHRSAVPSLLTP